MTLLLIIPIVVWIATAYFAGWLAYEKGRSVGNWVLLTLLFNIVALIAIAGAPAIPEATEAAEQSLVPPPEGKDLS